MEIKLGMHRALRENPGHEPVIGWLVEGERSSTIVVCENNDSIRYGVDADTARLYTGLHTPSRVPIFEEDLLCYTTSYHHHGVLAVIQQKHWGVVKWHDDKWVVEEAGGDWIGLYEAIENYSAEVVDGMFSEEPLRDEHSCHNCWAWFSDGRDKHEGCEHVYMYHRGEPDCMRLDEMDKCMDAPHHCLGFVQKRDDSMAFRHGCTCVECSKLPEGQGHLSDCAVHNEPAEPNGECNCGSGSLMKRYLDLRVEFGAIQAQLRDEIDRRLLEAFPERSLTVSHSPLRFAIQYDTEALIFELSESGSVMLSSRYHQALSEAEDAIRIRAEKALRGI